VFFHSLLCGQYVRDEVHDGVTAGQAFAGTPVKTLVPAVISASTKAPEITRWTVVLAVFELMTGPRGLSSDTPDYQALLDRRTSVLDFLKRAQRVDV
jgi:hypothetical protein